MYRILIALMFVSPLYADNWPQWRGPKNDGTSAEKNLPATWNTDKNVKWKLTLSGPGASTPCIWGDKIFLTAMTGDGVSLFCIGTDGKEKWNKPLGNAPSFKQMRDEGGTLATSSCSTDGKRVYVFVGTGKLAAFDFTGQEAWTLDTLKLQGKPRESFQIQFGPHWTPVLHEGRLYHTLMHRGGQHIVCVDATKGDVLWTAERKSDSPPGVESPDVYSSPFIWKNGDKELLIVHGNDYCTAHKLTDGSEVWRVMDLNPKQPKYNNFWRAIASPLVTPDLIVVPSCKQGVTVGVDPLKAAGEIKPGTPGEKWRLPKNTPDVPSPIRVGDLIYLMGEKGTLYCHEAATGKEIYHENITNMRHRGNPVYADGKLYLQGRDGVMIVVKEGREFEKLAENKLPDVFTASPAIADGVLYLRGWKDLYAISAK